MTPDDVIQKAKAVVGPLIMDIDGVAGVGVGKAALNVYLETNRPGVREQVEQILRAHAPGTPVHFVISGEFSSR